MKGPGNGDFLHENPPIVMKPSSTLPRSSPMLPWIVRNRIQSRRWMTWLCNWRERKSYSVILPANSRNRHRAFARRICRGERQSGWNSRGLATTIATERAREVATFNRFGL